MMTAVTLFGMSARVGDAASSSASSSSDSSVSISTADELAQEWFVANVEIDEVYLAVGVDTALQNMTASERICEGTVPSMQTRSTQLMPNHGCPDIFSAVNGSCTCLTGYNNTSDAWEFRITKRDASEVAGAFPTQIATTDTLQIDVIRTLLVPPSVTTL